MQASSRFATGRIWGTLAAAGILVVAWTACVMAQPASPHHGFLGGPWEVLVQMGHEGGATRTPLSIADENKPQKLGTSIPVLGTPIKVKLERYVPDLKWETTAAQDPNGGPVAKLSLRGESLQQDLWLCARDRERQSVSAHIGSVAIREIPGPVTVQLLQELTAPEVVGVLLAWLSEKEPPLLYAIKPGTVVALPGSQWKLSVGKYVPHYTIDRQTKQVTSQSDRPENPAIEVRLEGGPQEHRVWLWSQFFSSPHGKQQLPFRTRFVDFHLGGAGGYILVTAEGLAPCLLSAKDGKKQIQQVELGQRYPFNDPKYSFAVERVLPTATVRTAWTEGSEMLLHPALVATILQSGSAQQAVLEVGKPFHHKTASGTLVVLYRRVPGQTK